MSHANNARGTNYKERDYLQKNYQKTQICKIYSMLSMMALKHNAEV